MDWCVEKIGNETGWIDPWPRVPLGVGRSRVAVYYRRSDHGCSYWRERWITSKMGDGVGIVANS